MRKHATPSACLHDGARSHMAGNGSQAPWQLEGSLAVPSPSHSLRNCCELTAPRVISSKPLNSSGGGVISLNASVLQMESLRLRRLKALPKNRFLELRENPGAPTTRPVCPVVSPIYKPAQSPCTADCVHLGRLTVPSLASSGTLLLLIDSAPRKALYPFCW